MADGCDTAMVGVGAVDEQLIALLTKRLVESALEGEITDHLGYCSCYDVAGAYGWDLCNGHRTKTVLAEVGLVEIDVPHTTPLSGSNGSCRLWFSTAGDHDACQTR